MRTSIPRIAPMLRNNCNLMESSGSFHFGSVKGGRFLEKSFFSYILFYILEDDDN